MRVAGEDGGQRREFDAFLDERFRILARGLAASQSRLYRFKVRFGEFQIRLGDLDRVTARFGHGEIAFRLRHVQRRSYADFKAFS